MEEIVYPEKRLLIGIVRQAVYDFQHPEIDPLYALDASVFLLHSRELASVCGWFADELQWERIIARL